MPPNCDVCVDGNYGSSCQQQCGQCTGGAACDKATGHCPTDCEPGYIGPGCDTGKKWNFFLPYLKYSVHWNT